MAEPHNLQEFPGLAGLFIKELDLYPIILGPGHKIKAVSGRLIKRMGLRQEDVQGATILKILGIESFQELPNLFSLLIHIICLFLQNQDLKIFQQ